MNLTDREFQEKRSFIRMKVDTMVSFKIMGQNEHYEGRCRNLSGAGMLLETEKKLKLGDKLSVNIPSDGPNFSNLNALVEVIRVDHLTEQHKFSVGLMIKQILP